nr:hypothetical protein GCM10020092_102170 [Actinoplanes digitatis]
MASLGIPPALFPPLRSPGTVIGPVLPAIGIGTPDVIAVGSHDTASAVVGVPAAGPDFAYISCGTWSLVGVELPAPVLTEASRLANFTNEGGVDGTVRYLRNVMGLWPLQECLREWGSPDLPALLREAAAEPAFGAVVDLDDPVFLAPGDMVGRLTAASGRSAFSSLGRGRPVHPGQPGARTSACGAPGAGALRPSTWTPCTSSAAAPATSCSAGSPPTPAGCPCWLGPVEATALGNVLVQARAAGAIGGGLPALRAVLRETQQIVRYEPRGDAAAWRSAERRLEA